MTKLRRLEVIRLFSFSMLLLILPAGPLLISTDHRGTADGNPLRVFFLDVSVKVTGSENWLNEN